MKGEHLIPLPRMKRTAKPFAKLKLSPSPLKQTLFNQLTSQGRYDANGKRTATWFS
jgi:hypothetical protein